MSPTPPQKFVVAADLDGERLDRAMAAATPRLSRGDARRLIAAGVVFVSGKRSGICSRVVRTGDSVSWRLPARGVEEAGDDPELRVTIERAGFWIVDKPAGMPVEATRLGKLGTVADVLWRRFGQTPYVTHRLDAATSGLLVVAREASVQAELNRMFAAHVIARRYLAIVAVSRAADASSSALDQVGARVTIDRPLDGKTAVTHAEVVARSDTAAALLVDLETGRPRQIRRHLAELGAPVVGESSDGRRTGGRLMLHAHRLAIPVGWSGGAVVATAALPDELRSCLRALALDGARLDAALLEEERSAPAVTVDPSSRS